MTKKEILDKNGWIHEKGVFTNQEVSDIREIALSTKDFPGDLGSNDKLNFLLLDGRILDLARNILGGKNPVYFGDSVISVDSTTNGFHKDSAERSNAQAAEWQDKGYSLIRFAIYLQDHTEHSGGICLREKSHFTPSVEEGKMINVKSAEGDVLAWKLTTTHSANAQVLKWFPNKAVHPRIVRRLPQFMLQPMIRPRVAVFFTLGVKDSHLDYYLEYLKTRKYAVDKWKLNSFSDEFLANAKGKNLEVVDMSKNVAEINTESLRVGY